jgi:hypothetical protein
MEDNKKDKNESSELANNPMESTKIDIGEEIIPEEILKSIPAENRGKVVSIIKQSIFSGVMRRGNPISEKITEEHISKLIEKSDNQDLRDREERKSQRNYNLILIIIGLFFLGFLIVYLKEDKELLYKIIIAIISFVGGFGVGRTSFKKED